MTFTDPEIGAVGLTEAQARERGRKVRIGIAQLSPRPAAGSTRRATPASSSWSPTATRVLVGATSAGPIGGEVLTLLTLAVHARCRCHLRSMIYAYPTFHRGVQDALSDLG